MKLNYLLVESQSFSSTFSRDANTEQLNKFYPIMLAVNTQTVLNKDETISICKTKLPKYFYKFKVNNPQKVSKL